MSNLTPGSIPFVFGYSSSSSANPLASMTSVPSKSSSSASQSTTSLMEAATLPSHEDTLFKAEVRQVGQKAVSQSQTIKSKRAALSAPITDISAAVSEASNSLDPTIPLHPFVSGWLQQNSINIKDFTNFSLGLDQIKDLHKHISQRCSLLMLLGRDDKNKEIEPITRNIGRYYGSIFLILHNEKNLSRDKEEMIAVLLNEFIKFGQAGRFIELAKIFEALKFTPEFKMHLSHAALQNEKFLTYIVQSSKNDEFKPLFTDFSSNLSKETSFKNFLKVFHATRRDFPKWLLELPKQALTTENYYLFIRSMQTVMAKPESSSSSSSVQPTSENPVTISVSHTAIEEATLSKIIQLFNTSKNRELTELINNINKKPNLKVNILQRLLQNEELLLRMIRNNLFLDILKPLFFNFTIFLLQHERPSYEKLYGAFDKALNDNLKIPYWLLNIPLLTYTQFSYNENEKYESLLEFIKCTNKPSTKAYSTIAQQLYHLSLNLSHGLFYHKPANEKAFEVDLKEFINLKIFIIPRIKNYVEDMINKKIIPNIHSITKYSEFECSLFSYTAYKLNPSTEPEVVNPVTVEQIISPSQTNIVQQLNPFFVAAPPIAFPAAAAGGAFVAPALRFIDKEQFQTLVSKIMLQWGPGTLLGKDLASQLLKTRGHWKFDYSLLSGPSQTAFKNTFITSRASPACIYEVLRFFNIDQFAWEGKGVSFQRAPPTGFAELSEEISKEVYLTLYATKLKELEARGKFFDQWRQRPDKIKVKRPCFILEVDGMQAAVYPTIAHFDEKNCLTGFYQDSQKLAQTTLKTITTFNVNNQAQTLLLNQSELDAYNVETKEEGGKNFISLRRVKPGTAELLPLEVRPEAGEIKPRAKVARSSNIKSAQRSDRKRSNGDSEPASKRVDNKLASIPALLPPNPSDASKKQGAALNPLFASGMKSISELLAEQNAQKPGIPKLSAGSDNGALAAANASSAGAPENEELNHIDDFWGHVSRSDTAEITTKVTRESSKVDIFNGKTLMLPIQEKLSTLPTDDPNFSTLNPLLKPYQRNAAKKMVMLSNHGVTGLLCFEMGLGKTAVFVEYILQYFVANKGGKYFVLSRKGVLDSLVNDFRRFAKESQLQALKSLLIRGNKSSCYAEAESRLNRSLIDAKNNNDEFCKLLPLIRYASNINIAAKELIKVNDHFLSNTIGKALQDLFQTEDQALLKAVEVSLSKILTGNLYLSEIESALRSLVRDKNFKALNWITLTQIFKNESHLINSSEKQTALCQFLLMTSYLMNKSNADPLATINSDKLLSLVNFNLTNVKKCESDQFKAALESNENGVYFIGSHALSKNLELAAKNIAAGTVDEAHIAKNSESHANLDLLKLVSLSSSLKKKISMLICTATPWENDLEELLNLCRLGNPDLFPESVTKALDELLQKCVSNLSVKEENYKNKIASQYVLTLYKNLIAILSSLEHIARLKMHDFEVYEAWGDKIPTRKNQLHLVADKVNAATLAKLKEIDEAYKNPEARFKGVLNYSSETLCALNNPFWNHKLGLTAEKNDQVKADIDLFNRGTDKVKMREWIQQSALFSAHFQNPVFIEKMAAGKKMVIFVQHEATGKILRDAYIHLFGKKAALYYGGNSHEFGKIIEQFTKGDLQYFIATPKTGGAGLNLPQAEDVVTLGSGNWNPASQAQAEARILRIGHPGEKWVHTYDFGTNFEMHLNAVLSNKDLLKAFEETQSLSSFMRYLLARCYHLLLNKSKDEAEATRKLKLIEERLDVILHEHAAQAEEIMMATRRPISSSKTIVNPSASVSPSSSSRVLATSFSSSSSSSTRISQMPGERRQLAASWTPASSSSSSASARVVPSPMQVDKPVSVVTSAAVVSQTALPRMQGLERNARVTVPIRHNNSYARAIYTGLKYQTSPGLNAFTILQEVLKSNNEEMLILGRMWTSNESSLSGSLKQLLETYKLVVDDSVCRQAVQFNALPHEQKISFTDRVRVYKLNETGRLVVSKEAKNASGVIELLETQQKIVTPHETRYEQHYDLLIPQKN